MSEKGKPYSGNPLLKATSTDEKLMEKLWERCPQFLGNGFGNAVCVPEDEWRAMKRYIRELRTQLEEASGAGG